MNLPVNYNNISFLERKNVRNEYIELQKEKCFYCGKNLYSDPPEDIIKMDINWKFFPENFLKYPIHLQHNHSTGMTEGAVHSYCNAILWQYHGK